MLLSAYDKIKDENLACLVQSLVTYQDIQRLSDENACRYVSDTAYAKRRAGQERTESCAVAMSGNERQFRHS